MFYTSSDFRRMGRMSLDGSWGVALICLLIVSAIQTVLASTVAGTLLVAGPLTVGLMCVFLSISRYHEASYETLFVTLKSNFIECFLAYILQTIFVFLWSLLFLIPGMIKSYSYSMTFYILADNPQLSSMDALRESERMMMGHKWELFCLNLSFIGWYILSIFTCGLLLIYVVPYHLAAVTAFYRILAEGNGESQSNWADSHNFTA